MNKYSCLDLCEMIKIINCNAFIRLYYFFILFFIPSFLKWSEYPTFRCGDKIKVGFTMDLTIMHFSHWEVGSICKWAQKTLQVIIIIPSAFTQSVQGAPRSPGVTFIHGRLSINGILDFLDDNGISRSSMFFDD